jgi:hypothetical protein
MKQISALTTFVIAPVSMLTGGCAQLADGQAMAASNDVALDNGQFEGNLCDNYEDLNASLKAEIANATNASGKTC